MNAINPQSTEPVTTSNRGILQKIALLLPFVLAAAVHLSAVFKVFAALPIAFVFVRLGRVAGIVACITNMVIVWWLMGRMDAAWFFVMSVVFGATMSESMKLKMKLENIVMISMGMMLLAALLLFVSYAHKQGMHPVEMAKTFVSTEVDEFVRNAEKYKETTSISSQDLEKLIVDPEVTKRNVIESAPSVILIALLVMVISNMLLFLKFNVSNIRRTMGLGNDFFRKWKTPDHMVWPTIGAGFCLVVEIPGLTEVALNLFRVLMAIYAIQGIAIMSTMLQAWRVKRMFRPLIFIFSLTFLLPLVISIGFFDLWFNFREKVNLNNKV